jgi:hypothetical protein
MLQLFYLDVAKVDRGMLQMFQMHVASVCSKYFICFQMYVVIVFYQYVAYIAAVCSKRFSLMFQQVVSCCKLQVFYFGCFVCFTHMLQEHVLNISSVFNLMLY